MTRTRRYQLRKDTLAVVERGHPWIFRDQLSSAAEVLGDGDWVRLYDGKNQIVGHAIYESEGAIALRILRRGAERPDAAYIRAQLATALAKRTPLVERTDGIRLVNGESDGIPAVVIDRFGDHLVIASYSIGADAIARYLAGVLARESAKLAHRDPNAIGEHPTAADVIGPATSILLRPARRRRGLAQPPRNLRGTSPEVAKFFEGAHTYAVDLTAGQKTGAYLDLRGLRSDLAKLDHEGSPIEPVLDASGPIAAAPKPKAPFDRIPSLRHARVLNLFSYSGMLAVAAETAGAEHITSVDASARALAFAAEYHVVDRERHTFITADVFEWLPALSSGEQFDIVIVDPPSMTSTITKVPKALAAYRKLYRAVAEHVRPGGAIVAACCTSRIERAEFHHTVSEALGHRFKKTRELPPEIDHPVGFPQADYLKIAWWRRLTGI